MTIEVIDGERMIKASEVRKLYRYMALNRPKEQRGPLDEILIGCLKELATTGNVTLVDEATYADDNF